MMDTREVGDVDDGLDETIARVNRVVDRVTPHDKHVRDWHQVRLLTARLQLMLVERQVLA